MKMLDELSHQQLAELITAVGGSGANHDEITDLTPHAINVIATATDASKLDLALEKPQTFELRAALVRRKIELNQLAKDAASPKKEPVFAGLTVRVPPEHDSLTHIYASDGIPRPVRIVDGQRVVDVGVAAFRGLIADKNGMCWERVNQDIMARISRPNPLPPMAQAPR